MDFSILDNPEYADIRESLIAQIDARQADLATSEAAKQRGLALEIARTCVKHPRNCLQAIIYAMALHREEHPNPAPAYKCDHPWYLDLHEILHLIENHGGPTYSTLTIYQAIHGARAHFEDVWKYGKKAWNHTSYDPIADLIKTLSAK